MPSVSRVLPADPIPDLDAYRAAGGGLGIDAARRLGPAGILDEVEAAGLRGRGGAGFPTGQKWRTVAGYASAAVPSTVVVNGAEGEPGTFKDRAILRRNSWAVIEGGLIAALAVGADRLVVAVKESFARERAALDTAIAAITSATDWAEGISVSVATGPGEYLFGEETALLEVLNGRPPFPRLAPPFRHGVDDVGPEPDDPAGTVMAQPGRAGAPPTLANNVETAANVPLILAHGADWFREVGTPESPGTVVCTISGATMRSGVAEVPMGTTLAEVIEQIGGGAREGRTLVAAISGVANAVIPASAFATPLSYEAMEQAGTGLGAAGFIVFDDESDLAGVAAGVSRFLAVESCGQCTPCKVDGLAIADALDQVRAGAADDVVLTGVAERIATVADGARCYLAHQHQLVIDSFLRHFPGAFRDRPPAASGTGAVAEPVVPIDDLADGAVVLDLHQAAKQPDWTFADTDSGQTPVERLAEAAPD